MRETDEDGLAIRPNKSQLKREHEAVRRLILSLLEGSEKEWRHMGLDEKFRDGLLLARSMKPSGARNRQIKYLVRQLQEDGLEQVREWVENRELRQAEQNRRLHRLEAWRERLVEEGDGVLGEFLERYPGTDRQQLRQAVRSAAKERQTGKPAGAGRKLFRLLREIDAAAG